jgi:ribosomal protein S18 acetylase RimI-like enzyme
MKEKSTTDKCEIQTMAGLTLRPERADDLEFLQRLYASTRADEMALIDWSPEEKGLFLQSQFEAQHSYYLEHYQESRFDVIEQAAVAVGRLYVARWPDDICIIDIALLPEHRGRGLGGGILQALLDEAAATGKSVSMHVEINNPALHLYERLGFKPKGEVNGINQKMEWRSNSTS